MPSASFTYTPYNAEDYRVGKRVVDTNRIEVLQYFYEGDHVLFETDGSGSITAYNLYGSHLISRSVQGEQYYYLYNAHGDVVMLMDAGSGAIAATYRYDAFGNLIQQTGDANNNITYAGYQYDEETGLYYLNARYYNSNTGRFLTEDTYRGRQQDPLSLHRYTYCHNNPLIYWDPTGHAAQKYDEDYFFSTTTGERHPRCKIGSAGSYVYQMELMLEDAGYNPGDSKDGIFDAHTLNAVRLFQHDNGLNVTGIVEQKAWAYLQIQPQLKTLENRYKYNSISKEEYEAQVYGMKRMANNVPYKYDDRTLEDEKREMYDRFYGGLVIGKSLLDLQAMVLTMGASEMMDDGVDLLYDAFNAIVNPDPNAVGSVVYDSICLLLPDGPLNHADNVVDDVADLGKRAGKSGSKTINPNDIRFSQSSVNGSTEIVQSMKNNGWAGDPIDVVRMSDSGLTTIDNTRVVAARQAGIDVQANIHAYDDLLPVEYIDRFTTKKGVPTTWGDAITLRIGKQNAAFRNNNPFGSIDMDNIK